MAVRMHLEGAPELDRMLAQLPRTFAKPVLTGAGRAALTPIVRDATRLLKGVTTARTGTLAKSVRVSTQVARRQRGSTPRGAVTVYAGATSPHAHLIEFGTGPRYQKSTRRYTGQVPARPFMRPAWDTGKAQALAKFTDELRKRLNRTAARLASRATSGALFGSRGRR